MIKIERYTPMLSGDGFEMERDENGNWVKYTDLRALLPETTEPVAFGISYDGSLNDAFFCTRNMAEAVAEYLRSESEDQSGAIGCRIAKIEVVPLYSAQRLPAGWKLVKDEPVAWTAMQHRKGVSYSVFWDEEPETIRDDPEFSNLRALYAAPENDSGTLLKQERKTVGERQAEFDQLYNEWLVYPGRTGNTAESFRDYLKLRCCMQTR